MLDLLLVDDEPTIRLVVGDTLRAAGHRVTIVEDGAAAQRRLTEHRYDVVVTDVRMPHVNGLSLLHLVRQSHVDTDVILITAYGG